MPLSSETLLTLHRFLPPRAISLVLPLLAAPPGVCIHIVKPRKSVLGNYCYHFLKKQHRITLNNNLSPYPFLLTLLHELAHYFTYTTYGKNVLPHGKEWKECFHRLLTPFLAHGIFPQALHQHLLHTASHQLRAQAGADNRLYQLLHAYDPQPAIPTCYIQELPLGAHFQVYTEKPRRNSLKDAIYRLDEKRRTRYKAHHLQSGRDYLFSAVCRVCPLKASF